MARVVVDVMLKPEILDPQGQAVAQALPRLGFDGVTDAGTPVKGAKVSVAGLHDTTNARGVATITVPRGAHTGSKLVRATHSGYYRGTTHLRIT